MAGHQPAANATESPSAEPVVGVIYNPLSHRNRGQDLDVAAKPNVHVVQPQGQTGIRKALLQFQQLGVGLLIINGGDGTVRDVLTRGMDVYGDHWPDLAVLPKGKTNALNVDLGAPARWNLADAIAAYPTGQRISRRPVMVHSLSDDRPAQVGFILGAGGFTLAVNAGQDAHRLGAFNSLAVGVTSVWGVMRGLFGSDQNIWRKGEVMEVYLGPDGASLMHSGRGYEGRRSVMFSSTLERFPAGLKPFGKLIKGLKIMALDRPRRRTLAAAPAILFGLKSADAQRDGMHQAVVESFEFALEGQYILDGEAYSGGRFKVEAGPILSFLVP